MRSVPPDFCAKAGATAQLAPSSATAQLSPNRDAISSSSQACRPAAHQRWLIVLPVTLTVASPASKPCLRSKPRLKIVRRADRKSTRLNSSHVAISYAVFCLKKKKNLPHLSHLNEKKKHQN